MTKAKRCDRCGAAMVYDGRTTIEIVFVVNRFGVRPPGLLGPEIAPGWTCTGCGATVRDGVSVLPGRFQPLHAQRQSDPSGAPNCSNGLSIRSVITAR